MKNVFKVTFNIITQQECWKLFVVKWPFSFISSLPSFYNIITFI